MTTEFRTFRAPNMQAALDIVRQEMGHDAVIVETRHIDTRRLFFFGKRQEIEVTAGRGAQVRTPRANASSAVTTAAAITDELAPPPSLLEPISATKSTTAGTSRNTVTPPRWSPADVIDDRLEGPPMVKPPAALKLAAGALSEARLPVVRETRRADTAPLVKSRPMTIAAQALAARSLSPTVDPLPPKLATRNRLPVEPSDEPTPAAIQQRLDTLQRMILELGKERGRPNLHDLPPELFQSYTQLLAADVDEELARELVCRAKDRATRSQLTQPQALSTLLTGLIEQDLKIGRPIRATRGTRKIVALVGPTGVGKTTTLAKLAANLHLRDAVKVGLITVDTYRIAAVEQLRTYAELISLPMKVVTSPVEMDQALAEFTGLDVVLIDTAGRSPKDERQIAELKACLDAAKPDEILLVQSLAAGLTSLEATATSFAPAGVTGVIYSKLDEANGLGALWQLARQRPWPVSYLTTGQNVPEDIEPAHASRMARLVLGLDRIDAPARAA
jgi:flagellar biosynthesis protein FlhF